MSGNRKQANAPKIKWIYEQVESGQVIEFLEGELARMSCCDCGLVHDFTLIRLLSDKGSPKVAHIMVERNNRATGQLRRHMERK